MAYVRVDTDEGVTGCVQMEHGDAVVSLVRRRLKALIGEDPLMTERLWGLIWEIDRIEEMQLSQLGRARPDRLGHQVANGAACRSTGCWAATATGFRLMRRP